MNTTSLHIKIDNSVKTQAQHLADELGLSLSSVVKVLLKQFIRTKRLSIDIEEKPTAYFKQLMKEADDAIKSGKVVSFKSKKAMLDYFDER